MESHFPESPDYSSFKLRCRCCFNLLDSEQGSFKFVQFYQEAVKNFLGFEAPSWTSHKIGRICKPCESFLRQSELVRIRMIWLHSGFESFLKESELAEDFKSEKDFHQEVIELKQDPNPKKKAAKFLEKIKKKREFEDGSKKYSCQICKKLFSHKFTGMMHLKMVHLKIKDFKCDLCSYATSIKCNIIRHIQRRHIGTTSEKQKCPDCKLFFHNKFINSHQIKNHNKNLIDLENMDRKH